MFLETILQAKREEVARSKRIRPLARLKEVVRDLPPPRDFRNAIRSLPCAIIAEVKRRSPSKGRIREAFDPCRIAAEYEQNGAAAISILTDEPFFEGDPAFLPAIREVVDLPLLRKDFIIDPYQIYETRAIAGDALLLIAGILADDQMREHVCTAESLGLTPFVEVHTRRELERALMAGAEVIGINNRDLKTFSTDLHTTLNLAPHVPLDRIVVSESGIRSRADIETLMKAGIRAFLVGEALMRAEDVGGKLKELLGGSR
jgi:indole-3-glycerol phosphate synthase